jgi:hypothetical protein
VGSVLSALGMGGIVLGILVWEGGSGGVLAFISVGAIALVSLGWWLVREKRLGIPPLIDLICSARACSGWASAGSCSNRFHSAAS